MRRLQSIKNKYTPVWAKDYTQKKNIIHFHQKGVEGGEQWRKYKHQVYINKAASNLLS